MASAKVLSTIRIGQLTGTNGATWPDLVDPQGWPLLNDTGPYGVVGVDLGANTMYGDRTYIFFGDVATRQGPDDIENSDLVAWTDESSVLRRGGHLAKGWTFVLPFEPTGIEGQHDWQFCLKCGALFWNGDAHFKGACPKGASHDTFGVGFRFVLPFEPTAASGQHDWRFCGKCAAIFWDGDPGFKGICPAGGVHAPIGNRFVLPVAPPEGPPGLEGQSDWRFCGNCAGLFWNGDIPKGVCAGASGGGFRLHPVRKTSGHYDPFSAAPPIGETRSVETPNGAFSFDRRVYVFAGIAEEKYSHVRRSGAPAVGQYLFSKPDPSSPGPYDTEFLFSPKLGWCAADSRRSSFLSHEIRGLTFILPHHLPASTPGRVHGWRSCRKCEALFWNGDPIFKGVCQREGAHEADPSDPADYSLAQGLAEDAQSQANWRQCGKCLLLFWAGGQPAGLCPDGGAHHAVGGDLSAPHGSIDEDPKHQAQWRFCGKCAGLFFAGSDKGTCPRDRLPHKEMGYDFVLAHDIGEDAENQTNWRCCGKCAGLFFDGFVDKGMCPKDGAAHVAAGYIFTLSHGLQDSSDLQTNWRFCGKCAGLFFDGSADKGTCPTDGLGHQSIGLDFGLSHNPGADDQARGGWRFCTRCHGMVRSDQRNWFPWIAPCVVENSAHPNLPSDVGSGLVMIGFDFFEFRLAWMPLNSGSKPGFDATRYYHAAKKKWSETPDGSPGYGIFRHSRPGQYTHVSGAWLAGPGCWIVVYATAWDVTKQFDGPVVARISKDLVTWSDEISLFDPVRERAYGVYMHMPGQDHINPAVPPSQPPGQDNPGWAYGAFFLERFTTWDETSRVLSLSYLLSLGSPYQVQLMHSTLRLTKREARAGVSRG
jgi:hypothetical protein